MDIIIFFFTLVVALVSKNKDTVLEHTGLVSRSAYDDALKDAQMLKEATKEFKRRREEQNEEARQLKVKSDKVEADIAELQLKLIEAKRKARFRWFWENDCSVYFTKQTTMVFRKLAELHNECMAFINNTLGLTGTFLFIAIFLYIIWNIYNIRNVFRHHLTLELLWTLVPVTILGILLLPSVALLYTVDALFQPTSTIKAVGHQWFWSYEYSKLLNHISSVESFGINVVENYLGTLRLLETDNRLILQKEKVIRILVTAVDVIHSWAIPAFGIKTDACPGRLNQISLFASILGLFYGQCSELCGINHSFMPINLKVI